MATLVLNPSEEQVLEQVIRRCLSDLELEILHTDHAEFRKLLKERRKTLEGLYERLSAECAPTEH